MHGNGDLLLLTSGRVLGILRARAPVRQRQGDTDFVHQALLGGRRESLGQSAAAYKIGTPPHSRDPPHARTHPVHPAHPSANPHARRFEDAEASVDDMARAGTREACPRRLPERKGA